MIYIIEYWNFEKMAYIECKRIPATETPLKDVPDHLRPFYRYRIEQAMAESLDAQAQTAAQLVLEKGWHAPETIQALNDLQDLLDQEQPRNLVLAERFLSTYFWRIYSNSK